MDVKALRLGIALSGAIILTAPAARAQGVAFQPVIGTIPSGPALGVTPVVSADRRYVRLSLNAQFIGDVGFNTLLVPGAVGGGPGGPGALGGAGLGGLGMGMGAGLGGGGGAVGGQFLAGMNGVIDPTTGYGMGGMPASLGYGGMSAYSSVYPPTMGAMPSGAVPPRTGLPGTASSRPVKRSKNPRAKGKPPAGAAAPSAAITKKPERNPRAPSR